MADMSYHSPNNVNCRVHQLTLFGEWDEILDLIFVRKVNTLTNLQPEV